MKFLIQKENLQRGIQNVQRAISAKSPMPILSGILFQCSGETLKLTATDMEMSIVSSVPAEVLEQGELVIPARYIAEFSRRLPDLPILFETIGGGKLATIRYGQSEFNLNGYGATDFPLIQVPEGEFSFSLPAENLRDTIRKVVYASSNDDSRPIFTGVLLEIEGVNATMVATDTFRLATKKFKIDPPAPALINVVVPGKTLNEAFRASAGNDQVRVTLSKNHIMFESGDNVVTSRLITGRYPSYRQVIPERFDCVIRASVRELLEASERASLLAGESSLIMLQSGGEGVVISVRSENGWIREDIAASVEGEGYDLMLNVRFLSDVLKSCEGEEVMLKISGAFTPALLNFTEDQDYLAIIVPARTSRE